MSFCDRMIFSPIFFEASIHKCNQCFPLYSPRFSLVQKGFLCWILTSFTGLYSLVSILHLGDDLNKDTFITVSKMKIVGGKVNFVTLYRKQKSKQGIYNLKSAKTNYNQGTERQDRITNSHSYCKHFYLKNSNFLLLKT